MIIRFKLFESLEEVSLQNDFANTIANLYESEEVTVQNNFYDYKNDEISYVFSIFDFFKNKNLITIEYEPNESFLMIHKHLDKDENLNNFLKYILDEYDEISYFSGGWAYYDLKLKDLPEIIEKLSIDNYEMWKNSNKYNL